MKKIARTITIAGEEYVVGGEELQHIADQVDNAVETAKTVARDCIQVCGYNNLPEFREDTEYLQNDLVRYNNRAWRFLVYHPAGPWVSAEAVESSLYSEIRGAIDEVKTKVVNPNASEVTIQPNVMNVWETPMSTLIITKGNEIDGIVNNFVIRFTAGEDCGITFNGWTLQWYGGEVPTWTTGCTYEISIVDNIALWAEFEPKQA